MKFGFAEVDLVADDLPRVDPGVPRDGEPQARVTGDTRVEAILLERAVQADQELLAELKITDPVVGIDVRQSTDEPLEDLGSPFGLERPVGQDLRLGLATPQRSRVKDDIECGSIAVHDRRHEVGDHLAHVA